MSRSDATAFELWKEAGGFVDQHVLDAPSLVDPSPDHARAVAVYEAAAAHAARAGQSAWAARVMHGRRLAPGPATRHADLYMLLACVQSDHKAVAAAEFKHGRTPSMEEVRWARYFHCSSEALSSVFGSAPLGVAVGGCVQLDLSICAAEPSKFGGAWHSAFTAALAAAPSAALRAATSLLWERLWQRGPLREPHIESPPGELRFTWNRGGHYLEVSAHDDGHLEWFYRDPDGQAQGGDAGEELPETFFALLRHARP